MNLKETFNHRIDKKEFLDFLVSRGYSAKTSEELIENLKEYNGQTKYTIRKIALSVKGYQEITELKKPENLDIEWIEAIHGFKTTTEKKFRKQKERYVSIVYVIKTDFHSLEKDIDDTTVTIVKVRKFTCQECNKHISRNYKFKVDNKGKSILVCNSNCNIDSRGKNYENEKQDNNN